MTLPPPPPNAGRYRTVYLDCPWPEHGGGKIKRGADRHYPLMKLQDIYALPVGQWAARDAHCYSWVTNNYLPAGLEAMRRWGFRYVTKIDWFKSDANTESFLADPPFLSAEDIHRVDAEYDLVLQMGLGQYFRGVTESCLFGVRGRCDYRTRPDGKRAQGRTGFHARRTETHSQKPEKMVQMIELVSHAPYLEMFARSGRAGWDSWGDEAPCTKLT